MWFNAFCSTILRIAAIVGCVAGIALTASGAGLSCLIHQDSDSTNANINCPSYLDSRARSYDIGHWKQIGDIGNGWKAIYGQFAIFAVEILALLVIVGLLARKIHFRHQKSDAIERTILTIVAILLLCCAACEAWYSSGFGMVDTDATIAGAQVHLDFTIVSWTVACVTLALAGIFNLLDACLNCCVH